MSEERRALALKLAVQAHAFDPAQEILDTAKMFEAYLAGPESKVGKVYGENDLAEPPYGRYTDKDKAHDAYWQRDEHGWRYHDEEGYGTVYAWRNMQKWAPFTRIGDLT